MTRALVVQHVEVDAPAHVVMTARRQPGRTIVHLVNTASTNPLSPACCGSRIC
jgi:hypothetical protein